MGNCVSSKACDNTSLPVTPIQVVAINDYIITCDKNGNIMNVTQALLDKLNYSSLEGHFIGILMSDFMSMLHKKFFMYTFNESSGLENVHAKRSLIIYDIDKVAHNVMASFEHFDHNEESRFNITFEFINKEISYPVPKNANTVFKLNLKKCVLIIIDFIKYTELLHDKGAIEMIKISKRFHDLINELIITKYYPMIYLHEVGDSFVLVLNTDWTYNSEKFCASLAINFIYDLVQQSRDFVKIRTGVSYGNLHYGMFGSSFKLIGLPLNMATLLLNKCNENQINVSNLFYKKLASELKMLNKKDLAPGGLLRYAGLAQLALKTTSYDRSEKYICVKNIGFLKGFGKINFFSITISENEPFLIYDI